MMGLGGLCMPYIHAHMCEGRRVNTKKVHDGVSLFSKDLGVRSLFFSRLICDIRGLILSFGIVV